MLRRAATSLGRQRACEIGQCVLARDGVAIGEGSVVTIRNDPVQGIRYATLQEVKLRMRSIQNIGKITSAMKMVAASKMRVAQQATENSRGITYPLLKLLGDHPGMDPAKCDLDEMWQSFKDYGTLAGVDVGKNIAVAITSDKGLCGGINSTVCKFSRAVTDTTGTEDGKESTMVVIGEKGRAQLVRDRRKSIISTIQEVGKIRMTFTQASGVAEELLKTEYDVARVIYNRFKSAIAYKPTIATVLSPDALEKEMALGGELDSYEFEGPDRAEFLQDLAEFQLAVVLFNGMLENNCSEQASRMAAMESSTKNAKDMLSKLTLSYNRTRQAVITTELTEIISGAAALEK